MNPRVPFKLLHSFLRYTHYATSTYLPMGTLLVWGVKSPKLDRDIIPPPDRRTYWVVARSWTAWKSLVALCIQTKNSSNFSRWLSASLLPALGIQTSLNARSLVEDYPAYFARPFFTNHDLCSAIIIRISCPVIACSAPFGPISCWNSRIMGILHRRIYRLTSNAWISTLGGGHYLCKHIDKANAMAQMQHDNAIRMGDPLLAAECRIHMVYLAIQCGELEEAKELIAHEQQHVLDYLSSDERIMSMLSAAKVYTDKLIDAVKRANDADPIDSDPNFQRQRFTKKSMRKRGRWFL